MSDERLGTDLPVIFSPKQRAQLVAKALSDAARRARFSTKHRRNATSGGYRAQRGTRLLKFAKIASFIAIVVLPVLACTIYYAFLASDQYTAEARFTLRGGMPPKLDGIGTLTGAPSMLIIQDTQIVMNYLQSRPLVEKLEQDVNLRDLYSNDSIDFLSRAKAKYKIEKFLRYWLSMMSMSVQMPSGIVILTVRAFSPDDAARIATSAISSSETLVNQMNDNMIKDTLAASETERRRAEANLAAARANLERARNEEGMLSADKAADGLNSLITNVTAELARMQQELDTQSHYVNASSPTVRNLKTRISAANDEIARLQSKLTQSKDGEVSQNLAGSMSKLELANLENKIAEKNYASALVLLEHARLASETKLMYINTFVHPVAAQESRYPHRVQSIVLFTMGALAVWGVVLLLLGLAKSKLS